jgi:hypothetical protein
MKIHFITDHANNRLIHILKQFLGFSVLDIEIVVQKLPSLDNREHKNIYYLADFHKAPQTQGVFIYSSQNWNVTSPERINYNYAGMDFFAWEDFLKERILIKDEGERVYVNFDLFAQAFYQLSCYQEYILETNGRRLRSKARDISQNIDVFKTPNVNMLFLILERLIADMFGIDYIKEKRYPAGKQFAVVLTHDMDVVRKSAKDRVKHILHGINRTVQLAQTRKFTETPEELFRTFSKAMRRAEYNNIDYLIGLEEKNGVRSSLNVYVKNKRNKSGLLSWLYNPDYNIFGDITLVEKLKTLFDKDFEVGIHGSYASGYSSSLLGEEVKALEGIVRRKILGGRQHFLDYSVSCTPKIFAEATIEYDTSLGFRDLNGFRAGACLPYYLYDFTTNNTTNVLEIPLVIMDGVLFDHQDGTKESAWRSVVGILEKIKGAQGCSSVVWHQRVFNNRDYPFWEEIYLMLISWVKDNNGVLLKPGELNKFWRSKKTDKLILTSFAAYR